MTKITQFDKTNLKIIRQELDAALKTVGDKYGMNFRIGNIGYTHDSFKAKIESTLNDAKTGNAVSPELADLRKYANLFLGDNFVEDTIYNHRGKKIKFVGIMPRSHKYPVIYQDLATGKKYKMDAEVAKNIVDPSYKPVFNFDNRFDN